MELVLWRLPSTPKGTFGVLTCGGYPFALTLERRWAMNRASVGDKPGSCIPEGVYECMRVDSPRHGDTFEVMDVEGRTDILFHKGNLDDDSRGCILVGESFDPVNGEPGITASAKGFDEFKQLLKTVNRFTLTIRHF